MNALKNAGKDAFFQMEFGKAVELFSKAIALKPNDTNLYGLRCAAYNKLYKYDEALRDVDKMIELRPYNHKTYLLKGNCHFFLGQFDDAVEAYESV
jgi:Flp pilus assembly protein TadD